MDMTIIRETDDEELEALKVMILSAEDWQEADSEIMEFHPLPDTGAKLQFLFDNFDVQLIGASSDQEADPVENDYIAVLSAIVGYNRRW